MRNADGAVLDGGFALTERLPGGRPHAARHVGPPAPFIGERKLVAGSG